MKRQQPGRTRETSRFTPRMTLLFAALVLVLSLVAIQVYRIVGQLVAESERAGRRSRLRRRQLSYGFDARITGCVPSQLRRGDGAATRGEANPAARSRSRMSSP